MKKFLLFSSLISMLLLAVVSAPAENPPTAADSVYGAYPTEYKKIVNRWLETHLVDPTSAVVEMPNAPKSVDIVTEGAPMRGFLVEFTVNSRNKFGTPTGKQKHSLAIRNGEVIKASGF